MLKFNFVFILVSISLLFSSCNEQEEISPLLAKKIVHTEENSSVARATSYSITTSSSCGSGQSLPAPCYYSEGGLKTQLISNFGTGATLRVRKCNGTSFQYSGTLYIKSNSICGTVWTSKPYYAGNAYVDVSVNLYFPSGQTVYLYPTTISSNFGARSHSNAVTVTSY